MLVMQGGWCRHVPRLVLIVLSGILLAANLKDILPPPMQTMVEAMVVLLSLVDVYVLQANLGRRSFTVTLMCMEIVEATLSVVMLFPRTCGLSRVAISTYLVVNNGIDVFAGFYYEAMAHKLTVCKAAKETQHPLYKVLTGTGFKFFLILASLFKVAITATMDFVHASYPVQSGLATTFFVIGLGQVAVASLAGGSLFCFPCLRSFRPTDGSVRGYLPFFVVGAILEITVSSPLSLEVAYDYACDFQSIQVGWSILLCFPIVHLLETSLVFRCFGVPYRAPDKTHGEGQIVLEAPIKFAKGADVSVAVVLDPPREQESPVAAVGVVVPEDDPSVP